MLLLSPGIPIVPHLLAATHQDDLDDEVFLVGALQPVILWGPRGQVRGRLGLPVGTGDLPPQGPGSRDLSMKGVPMSLSQIASFL